MSKFIKNKGYKNHKVSFKDTEIFFNEECIAEVEDEHAIALIELSGYEMLEDEDQEDDNENENKEELDSASMDGENTLREKLSSKTIKQLTRYANSENIDLGSATKKEDIVDVIVTAKESN